VTAAAGGWLRRIASGEPARLADPVLLRHVIWAGVDRGLPLQFHVGLGDPDLRLHRADPLLMTEFIESVEPYGVPVMLLHCYPFHRHAGHLAQAYPHVHFDVGLAVNYVGSAAREIVAQSLELAPFAKILYSSDAWGPAELHYLGALLWRRALGQVLAERVRDGDWSRADAIRVATMVGRDNARRVYRLD
jgi:predicted TIM-barrel fold metal-dependent hydrolase